MTNFQKRKKRKRQEPWEERDSYMKKIKKRGMILHKFTRVYDTWSRNYISSLFLLFPLSTCLSIQPRVWCNFPATSVNCMHFRQRNRIIKFGVHVYRVLPLRIYLSIYPLKKKEQVYVYMYIYIYFESYTRGRHIWKIQCLVLFSPWKALCLPRSTIFIFNPCSNICSNFVFSLLFSSLFVLESNAFKKK